MPPEVEAAVTYVVRWVHFVAGITWIGILYWFNLVNVRFMRGLEAPIRTAIAPRLLTLSLAWFRYSALVTVLTGLVLVYFLYWQYGDFITSNSGKTILLGTILGLIMLFNVWVLIWPNQRKIIQANLAGQAPNPQWGRTALYASRTNVTLSFPMLLFMAGSSHYPQDWLGLVVVGLASAALGLALVLYIQWKK